MGVIFKKRRIAYKETANRLRGAYHAEGLHNLLHLDPVANHAQVLARPEPCLLLSGTGDVSVSVIGAFEYLDSYKELRNIGLIIYPMAYADVTLYPVSWDTMVITRWKKAGARISGFSIDVPFNVGVKTELTEKYPEELSLRSFKLVTSKYIVYSLDYPYQGFHRLWDTESTDTKPSNELLSSILSIATHELS